MPIPFIVPVVFAYKNKDKIKGPEEVKVRIDPLGWLVRRRAAARCLGIFQDYVFYAATNVLLLLVPILMGLLPQTAKYSVDFLAAGYVLVMCRASYSIWVIRSVLADHAKSVKEKHSFALHLKEALTNIIEAEVRDTIDSWTVRGLSTKIPWLRLFAGKLLDMSEADIHREITRLVFRIGVAFTVYLGITHFLAAPLMFGAEEMPLWKSCIYPFWHAVELCAKNLCSADGLKMAIMLIGLYLYSETAARIAAGMRMYDRGLPAVFFIVPMLGFVFALFKAAGCPGAHVYTYFLAYLCASKAFLDSKGGA